MQPKTQICLLILYVGWGDRCVRRSEVNCSYCLLLGTSHIFWVLSASYWPRICWSASPWDLCVCQSSTRITRAHHCIQLLRTEIRFTCFQGKCFADWDVSCLPHLRNQKYLLPDKFSHLHCHEWRLHKRSRIYIFRSRNWKSQKIPDPSSSQIKSSEGIYSILITTASFHWKILLVPYVHVVPPSEC